MSKLSRKESLDNLLSSIAESVDSTSTVVDKLTEIFNSDNAKEYPELVKSLLQTSGSGSNNSLDSVSLLSLKNSALLGYVTDLAIVLALRLKSMKQDDQEETENHKKVLESAVTNRLILEKGVKSLEKKINYQLEKMVNAYHRREKEQEEIENKINKETNEDNENGSEEEEDDDEEEEEEEGLNFKPNPSALLSRNSQANGSTHRNDENEEVADENDEETKEKSKEKYKPPKISATTFNDPDKEVKSKKQRNLQSMDEYLQDISEAPSLEKSIGSTIINKGRDVKSKKQLEKEAEIQRYEEENFTRLPATKTKENKKDRAKRMRNEFFGEDWSMFDNNRDINDKGSAPKKRKRISAWERAKRKIDD